MNTKKPLLILTSLVALVGIGATAAFARPAPPIDADADVFGKRVAFEAETRQSVTRVTFLYGDKRIKARLTEIDREDRTKDWDATTRAFKSDRHPGATVKYRVRVCDSSGCTTRRFQELVTWDD